MCWRSSSVGANWVTHGMFLMCYGSFGKESEHHREELRFFQCRADERKWRPSKSHMVFQRWAEVVSSGSWNIRSSCDRKFSWGVLFGKAFCPLENWSFDMRCVFNISASLAKGFKKTIKSARSSGWQLSKGCIELVLISLMKMEIAILSSVTEETANDG